MNVTTQKMLCGMNYRSKNLYNIDDQKAFYIIGNEIIYKVFEIQK